MFTVGLDISSIFILFSQSMKKRTKLGRFLTSESSKPIKEIIFGSLLGDGKLEMAPKATNARFGFTQSEYNKDYFISVYNSLNPLFNIKYRKYSYLDKRTGKTYFSFNF
jgi:hypothetical protein